MTGGDVEALLYAAPMHVFEIEDKSRDDAVEKQSEQVVAIALF